MVRSTPKVRFGFLELSTMEGKSPEAISVGSVEWYTWLNHHHIFCFENVYGTITVRKEQISGGGWYAYCGHRGSLWRRYLGKPEELTLERLDKAIQLLTPQSELALNVSGDLEWKDHSIGVLQHNSLLATKLYVPPVHSKLVLRPRLTKLLNEGMQRKLTLITAPAGFGKTTLLNEWLRDHPSNEIPFAWISLGESDNDPASFLAYFIAALRTIQADIGKAFLDLLHSAQLLPPLELVLTELVNEIITTQSCDFALILDDYYLIEAQPIHVAITFLLDHLPPHMHVVIASRADPPLPLARLRAQGQLTELHATELRFTSEEVDAFLNRVMGLNLLADDVVTLENCTEGWITGLQLAVLSLKRQEDLTSFIRTFSGNHRYVLDYFSEEVIQREPHSIQTFLLKTSILNRLSGPLCEAVTGQSDGQMTLERLEQANLFLFSLDDERCWYRYHHLFRDFLGHQLYRVQSDVVHELYRRASEWYERRGLEAEAIDHALAGEDFERAARLVEQTAPIMLVQSKVATLLKWLETLPHEQVRSRPRLRELLTALGKEGISTMWSTQCHFKEITPSIIDPLSEREVEVLRCIVNGMSNQEIAQQMSVAECTIKWHLRNIYSKLNVHRRAQLIVRTRELNL